MSNSSRVKMSLGSKSDLCIQEVFNSDDAICEILLLLPPETLYKLILVSKRWLQVIASPYFRHTYLRKWKPSYQLIGFFLSNVMYLGRGPTQKQQRPRHELSLPLLSTSNLGDEVDTSGVLKKLGYYIDSSNGVLLCGRHPKAYYLWDSSTKKHHQIPRHRVHFEELCMSLITEYCPEQGFSYKVIRAESVCFTSQSKKVKIETYSSKTKTWSYSQLSCSEPLSLSPWSPGRVIDGTVYWHANNCNLGMYDSKSEDKKIDLIKLPKNFDYDEHVLGETSDGCLQYGWSNKSVMEIWKLEKVNNVMQWNVLYKMSFKVMWRNNPVETSRFSTKTKETQLLAFLNQRSDLVYIRNDSHIFMCNVETQKVEDVLYQGRSPVWEFCKGVPFFRQSWPSSSLLKSDVSDSDDGNSYRKVFYQYET